MVRYAMLLALAPALFGQLTTDILSKAPPAVDEALRARINKFYQFHVDGRFRQAEAMVSEDSKDFYYNSTKSKYFGFEIKDIQYSENFTKAKATVLCQVSVMIPGFAGKPFPAPMASYWKVENGDWYWYINTSEIKLTPMGGNIDLPGAKQGPTALPKINALPTDAAMVLGKVKADKDSVALKAGAPSSGEITVSNSMPGTVFLTVQKPAVEGLEVECPASLPGNGKGTVTYRFKPGKEKPSASVTANILIQPTNESLPVTIRFE
jgi:hypothetical protein